MYHDPVSTLADSIGRSVDYMDHADYQRHKQGGLSPVAEVGAVGRAHGIGNFWNNESNQPAAVFAHNYMRDLQHRPLDDLPRGVPLDLSAPWHMLGEQQDQQPDQQGRAAMPPLAATADTDEMFDYLCKALEQDDQGFMEALRQIGQTDAARNSTWRRRGRWTWRTASRLWKRRCSRHRSSRSRRSGRPAAR